MRLGDRTAAGILAAALVAAGPIAHMPSAIAETSPISSGAQAPGSSSPSIVREGLAHRARSSVLIKEIKRTVRFAPMSAELDAEAMEVLAAAAKLVPESATQVTVSAVGYVQQVHSTATTSRCPPSEPAWSPQPFATKALGAPQQ